MGMTEAAQGVAVLATLVRLADRCEYGPSYDRNVAVSLADARLFLGRGEIDAAYRYAMLAQARAGVITFEEYQALTAE